MPRLSRARCTAHLQWGGQLLTYGDSHETQTSTLTLQVPDRTPETGVCGCSPDEAAPTGPSLQGLGRWSAARRALSACAAAALSALRLACSLLSRSRFPEALIHQLQLGWAGSAFCLVTVHLYLLCIVMGEFYKFF